MSKSYAARYAQLRRDHETTAREALELRIPSQYFSAEVVANGDYNKTTKVLMATISYLKNVQPQDQADDNDDGDHGGNQVSDEADNRDVRSLMTDANSSVADALQKTPFFISTSTSSNRFQVAYIQRLRQVATRLVQKIEERLQGEEHPSKELTETIEKANDLMIDTIAEVERIVPRKEICPQHWSNGTSGRNTEHNIF